MQQNIKEKFEQSSLQNDPFMKELYKKVRNNTKKLEDVNKIEQKLREGAKINKDQQDKLNKKQMYQQSVDESIELFDLYIKNQPAKKEEEPKTEEVVEEPVQQQVEEETKLGSVQSHGMTRARTTYRSTDTRSQVLGVKTMIERV